MTPSIGNQFPDSVFKVISLNEQLFLMCRKNWIPHTGSGRNNIVHSQSEEEARCHSGGGLPMSTAGGQSAEVEHGL